MIRYYCDRSVVLGRPPAAESGDCLGIEFELILCDFHLVATKV